jgi:hypothetical protein
MQVEIGRPRVFDAYMAVIYHAVDVFIVFFHTCLHSNHLSICSYI